MTTLADAFLTRPAILPARLDVAARHLSRFILSHARRIERHLGFGYVETAHAPGTWEQLQALFRQSQRDRQPLPVYSGGSDRSIYSSPEVNWAFRYWHDATHCLIGADFSTAGEYATARAQLDIVEQAFGKGSDEAALLVADTLGQVCYFNRHGRFPEEQRSFVYAFINNPRIALDTRY